MASSGPSALLHEGRSLVDDSGCASAANKDAGGASSITVGGWDSPKPSTSRGGPSFSTSILKGESLAEALTDALTDTPTDTPPSSVAPNDIVYDLVSVDRTTSEDSPAKFSMTSEDDSMRISNDSLLADLGITANLEGLTRGPYESSDSALDTPLISLSPYKIASGTGGGYKLEKDGYKIPPSGIFSAASLDLCDSDKCSSSDTNARDLESLLKEAGIEEIKDDLVLVSSKTSSGQDMLEVLADELLCSESSNLAGSKNRVLTIRADVERVPANAGISLDAQSLGLDTPEHSGTDPNFRNATDSNSSLEDPRKNATESAMDSSDRRQGQRPPDMHKRKKDGSYKKDSKQQPKGRGKPTLQKQLKFSIDDDNSEEEMDDDVRKYRDLKIIPRTSQYEKHPLLQVRTESGMSAIEQLLMEHEEKMKKSQRLKKHKSLSVEDGGVQEKRLTFQANRRKSMESYSSRENKIIPRTSQYERHPLLEKTESGLSELEQYLKEKEEELIRQERSKRRSEGSLRDSDFEARRKVTFPNVPEKRPSLGALMPRTSQYQKHPLLQSRDEETGLSEIEKFLHEKQKQMEGNEKVKEEEEEEGKKRDDSNIVSATANGKEHCGRPKDNCEETVDKNNPLLKSSKNSMDRSRPLSEETQRDPEETEAIAETCTLLPEDPTKSCRQQQRVPSTKRVHFQKGSNEEEIEDLGSVRIKSAETSDGVVEAKGTGNGSGATLGAPKGKNETGKDGNKCCVIL